VLPTPIPLFVTYKVKWDLWEVIIPWKTSSTKPNLKFKYLILNCFIKPF